MEDIKDLEKEKKGLNQKLVTILSISLFVVVFAVLLTVASIYDLEISKILTKGNLAPGEYISLNGFGLFFEAFGATPIWLAFAAIGVIFFWNSPFIKKANIKLNEKGKKVLSIFCMIGSAGISVVGFYFFVSELFKYTAEHMGHDDYAGKGYVFVMELLVAILFAVLAIFTWKNFKEDTHKQLLKFAFVLIVTAAFYLIVHFIKGPIGRCRFRTMNYLNDFSYYTPWYIGNGSRSLVDFANVNEGVVKIGDSCKSFPSGHTFSAGVIYSLLSLPYLFKKLDKTWVKSLFCIGTIGYTGVVAIARIVVGAHYMSDVLFGGTMAFIASMIAREIFICKGSHFTCFKKDKEPLEKEEDNIGKKEEEKVEE